MRVQHKTSSITEAEVLNDLALVEGIVISGFEVELVPEKTKFCTQFIGALSFWRQFRIGIGIAIRKSISTGKIVHENRLC